MRECLYSAGELYPTQVRTTAHGISAGIAKLGALWASVWFNYITFREIFWFTACTCLPAALTCTIVHALSLCCKSSASSAKADRMYQYQESYPVTPTAKRLSTLMVFCLVCCDRMLQTHKLA